MGSTYFGRIQCFLCNPHFFLESTQQPRVLSATTQRFANEAEVLYSRLKTLIDSQAIKNSQLENYVQSLHKQINDLQRNNNLLTSKNQQLEADNRFQIQRKITLIFFIIMSIHSTHIVLA